MLDWKFCPRCGSEARHVGDQTELHVQCVACDFVKYDNPLPTTMGFIVRSKEIFLLRRSDPPEKGKWDAIGGFLAGSETAEENLRRECDEETGLQIDSIEFFGSFTSVYGSTGLTTIGLAFECHVRNMSSLRLSRENSECGWFAPTELPPIAFADVNAALGVLAARIL